MTVSEKTRVTLAHSGSRDRGVRNALRALGVNPVKNRHVLLKPNLNTADPAPGSTHNDTLRALIQELWAMGATSISLGERSYQPTGRVVAGKGMQPLLDELDVRLIDFDALPIEDWVPVNPKGSHWPKGFRVARPVLEADCLVFTGCLKTHQYGGVFTMSLKLSVGVVPTSRHGFNYMQELHSSPHQRKMIAEVNVPFRTDLIVMDGVEVFVDGGPAIGKLARGDCMLAATDRVAADAVGLAVLKTLGANRDIMSTKIFDQEQIARAVELGLGAASPDEIDLVSADEAGGPFRDRVAAALNRG